MYVDGRQTAAFTLKTRPPGKVVGAATTIRQAADDRVKPQDTSAIDQLVKTLSRLPDDKRARRSKKDSGDPAG